MLVLSRRLNERLLIPCIQTAVQVLSIQGGQVRLGVDAPPEVAVFREEIYKGDPERESSADPRPAIPPRLRTALRNRLAGLAQGLDRVHAQLHGQRAVGAQAALSQLGAQFDELARIVNVLLEGDGAADAERTFSCAVEGRCGPGWGI
jgi:carbon storage regulator